MNLMPDKDPSPEDLLAIYLQDHLTAAVGGVELFRRAAKSQREPGRREALSRLGTEVAEDRDTVSAIMQRLGVRRSPQRLVAGWGAEKLGRLKPNGTLLRRSPLSDVIELEAMRAGVMGKMDLWRLLQGVSTGDNRLRGTDFNALLKRAQAQYDELGQLHRQAAGALRGG
jgi:hypothetical protein